MGKRLFGTTKEGKNVTEYTLTNANGMQLVVIDLGATITAIKTKGKDGLVYDVALGHETPEEYQKSTCYFGATIGRNSNRIHNAKVTLDGVEYTLEVNDNENNLHSGTTGFHAIIWDVANLSENAITFTHYSKEEKQDFPGNMSVKVTYTLTNQDEVVISYEAQSDKTTVANFTNHCYFNLDGHASGSVEEQELEIRASYFTPVVDGKAIPTGEIESVSGTPMDFRNMKKIGQDMHADFNQLNYVGGYDHNYVLDKADDSMQLAARAKAAKTGICMDVYTDCVGVQLYAGNFIQDVSGKEGVTYGKHNGFCLETQYFPNAMNEEKFKAPILKAGETYKTETKYCFFTEK